MVLMQQQGSRLPLLPVASRSLQRGQLPLRPLQQQRSGVHMRWQAQLAAVIAAMGRQHLLRMYWRPRQAVRLLQMVQPLLPK